MLPTLSLGDYRSNADAEELRVLTQPLQDQDDRAGQRQEGQEGQEPTARRKVLIVQGDWEAGMSLLALDLKDAGHEVGKVFFCAPDVIYKFKGIRTHMFR
ncbi:MAG: hypothetical protein EOP87_19840, partial [Verrucomicrobiaceae bacterium]